MKTARAYSYIRFSTAEQLKGKSLARQTEGAALYCKQHGLMLDTGLTLHDLGVSAFRGKNVDTGALGLFLKAVHAGTVARGSFLLVETFDRMSRESAYDAQLTLQNIIHAGITVVTLMDGKQYSVPILRADPLALIYAILLMSRGHEESATKSKRVADAWRRKRLQLVAGKLLTANVPSWIKLDAKRRPQVIPHRARVVRQMFASYLAGKGKDAIAIALNRAEVPTFNGGQYWRGRYVLYCLRNRAVVGEFQPGRSEVVGKRRKRIPDGPVISGYFPAIVDRATFDKVQARLAKSAGSSSRGKPITYLLAGLAKCPRCGDRMRRVKKSGEKPAKLVCGRAKIGAGCQYRSVPVDALEQTLIANAKTLAAEMPESDPTIQAQVARTEAAIKALETRLFDLAMLLDGTPSRTIAERIQQAEAERDRLSAQHEELQARLDQNGARMLREYAKEMRGALQWYGQTGEDLLKANAALRECFSKVVVDYEAQVLVLHWRHGPTSTISYDVSRAAKYTL